MTSHMSAVQSEIGASEARHWSELISREEIDELLRRSDGQAWLIVLTNWALVLAAMAMVAIWPNPLTVIVALFAIGARQLGCAVIMHDASHRALFSSRRLNDWVGSWLAAYPVWSDLHTYRPYHLKHHAKTWTEEDPDLRLATAFPVTGASLRRKIWRDLSGQTGIKFARFSAKRDFGEGPWRERIRRALGSERFRGMLITNAALLGLLSAFGQPALYLLWVGAYLTTNTLVTRIRAIAEHSMVPDPADELRNTRTTLVSWWERCFLAPNFVNYHLEHHLLMTVPPYNLPKLHRLLRERGVLEHALVDRGYLGVLRRASSLAAA
ncbi:MAG: fatty acid desaturase family protein [Myxococcota bacterium]